MSLLLVIKVFFTIFGLLIGSFLNVVISRVPIGESVISPRSKCPKCGHQILWFENIPILSYLLLKGKCRGCKAKISLQYPLVELACGLIAWFVSPSSLNSLQIYYSFVFFSIAVIFLAQFLIDIKHQLLPDKLNIALLIIIFPYVITRYSLFYWLIGGLVGFWGPYIVTYLFYKIRGVIGLGGGDIKLFGILGLILGPLGIIHNIFFSCFLGAVIGGAIILIKKKDKDIPFAFGPFIIMTAILQIFFADFFYQINFLRI